MPLVQAAAEVWPTQPTKVGAKQCDPKGSRCGSIKFPIGCQDHRFADQDLLTVDSAMVIQLDPALGHIYIGDLDLGINLIVWSHRARNFRTGPYRLCRDLQLLSDHRRDQTCDDHPMGNAPLKDRVAGQIVEYAVLIMLTKR